MSEGDTNERDDPEQRDSEDRSRVFQLKAGLRPLSKLLGTLIEVNVIKPPSSVDSENWTAVDQRDVDQQRHESRTERKRTKRVRKAGSDRCLIGTRFDDDEFVVTADILGTSEDELSVGINPETNHLVIGKDGTVLERVSLPWQTVETTRVWFNNGVLEVRVRSTGP